MTLLTVLLLVVFAWPLELCSWSHSCPHLVRIADSCVCELGL